MTSRTDENLLDKLKVLLLEHEGPSDATTSVSNQVAVAFQQERFLVAWVLLTRLPQYDLDQAWNQYGSLLESFAIEDILADAVVAGHVGEDSGDVDSDPMNIFCLYLRLVAQVSARLTNYPPALGQCLLDSWKRLTTSASQSYDNTNTMKENNSHKHIPVVVHVDVSRSLEIWMEQDPTGAEEKGLLDIIWNFYALNSFSYLEAYMTEKEAQRSSQEIDEDNARDGDQGREVVNEWKVMAKTLEAILNDPGSVGDEQQNLNMWDEVVLGIVQTHGNELLSDGMVPSIVKWITLQTASLEPYIRLGWNEWFLTMVQTRIKFDDVFRLALLRHPATAIYLNQLLMTHVVSPASSDDDNSLRALAWQTTAILVECCGWNWMMIATTGNTSLAHNNTTKNLCAWIRLASGEWRIQLELQASATSNGSSALQQATALPVGHACARLLIDIIHFCIQLEEQQSHTMSLSADALLHIRQSLQDALWTTVEYLKVYQQSSAALEVKVFPSATSPSSSSSSFYSIAIELLGTLLMEINIWDLPGNATLANTHTSVAADDDVDKFSVPKGILECLELVLPDLEEYSLLPGLVSILAGADESPIGDKAKITRLFVDFWDPLIDFLEGYWQRDNCTLAEKLDDTVTWACSCTELAVQLDDGDINGAGGEEGSVLASNGPAIAGKRKRRRRRLAMSLIEWIQGILQAEPQELRQGILPILQSYLSLAVGCYMTLQNEETQKPREHESRVIFRALQVCEMQQQPPPQAGIPMAPS